MIIEYDINCFARTLVIKFPYGYKHLREEILKLLDGFYDYWHGAEYIDDPEEKLAVRDTCLEEYMMDRLSEVYNIWEEWESVYYGDDEEERAIKTESIRNKELITLSTILKKYEFKTPTELWNYIDYLESVKADYELLKEKVNSLKCFMDKLY